MWEGGGQETVSSGTQHPPLPCGSSKKKKHQTTVDVNGAAAPRQQLALKRQSIMVAQTVMVDEEGTDTPRPAASHPGMLQRAARVCPWGVVGRPARCLTQLVW